jgi:CO/xanthine dehydrogenase Mo-binding subunit
LPLRDLRAHSRCYQIGFPQMTGQLLISRRQLIVSGLIVAFVCGRSRAATGTSAIGGFVRISPAGGISLVMPSVEMGQGIYTAEAALLALHFTRSPSSRAS